MRRVRPFVLVAALAFAPARALAQESALPLELDWRAPAECYTAEMVQAELARIAHVRPGRAPAKLSARVRIEKRGERYRLSLHTERDGEIGERKLVASECRALCREVTLVLALAFGEGVELVREDAEDSENSSADAGPPPAESAPAALTPQPAKVVPAPSEPRAPAVREPARRDPARLAIFAGGGVLFRALPSPAAQAFAGIELGTRSFRLAPRLSLIPRSDDALGRNVDARYDGIGGALAACFAPVASLVAACLNGSVMAVRGRSWGASESGSAVAPWYTAGPSVAAAWPAGGSIVSARLEGALQISLNEPRFVVDGLGDAHAIPRLAPSVALGVLLRP